MKGDFSRFTFDRSKHYAGVRLQQGRVQLDADWNEQDDLDAYHRHTLAADLIGPSGAPAAGGGFDVTIAGSDIRISKGRYYVDGLLCENEAEVSIAAQPDLPGFVMPETDGRYLAYLDVWPRSVTALEDPDLLELALGGADTATRVRTVWQVKLLRLAAGEPSFFPGWQPDPRPRPTLAARLRDGGSFKENQLYRIEVHKPGLLGEATFKWSRDNGAVAALIENPATNSVENRSQIQITRQIGPDQSGFATDQWIEVTDETRLLQGQPGILAKLSSVLGQVLGVEGWPGPSDPVPVLPDRPQIRRWDSDADQIATLPATNDGYLDLDGTLEVRFGGPADAYFRTGDYWVVPVRAAARALWPVDGSDNPLALAPHGVQHHYAPLYVLELVGKDWTRTSPPYRKVFQGTTVIPGPEKLNRREDDRMTASLTITKNLTVEGKVTVGKGGAAGGRLELDNAPLVLAAGSNTDRGLQFPGTGAFLRYSSDRMTLGVGSSEALSLRHGNQNLLTLGNGRLGLQTTSLEADVHIGGDTVLLRANTSLVIDKRLRYTDGSQRRGRILTSDDNGNATWQEAPDRKVGVPVFVRRFEVAKNHDPSDWRSYRLPSTDIPDGIQAVVLEVEAAKSSAGDDGYLAVRRGKGESENLLLRGRASGGGDSIAWSTQGIFPVKDNTFEYAILGSGFENGWVLRVVGYFP